MVTTMDYPMAKSGSGKGGRPTLSAGDQGTRQVRVFADLADIISVLTDVLGQSCAQLLDPMIRPDLEALHDRYRTQIDAVLQARKAVAEAVEKAKEATSDTPVKRPKKH